MSKVVLFSGALALAAVVGFALGRRAPEAPSIEGQLSGHVAWAQRLARDPLAEGRVEIGGEVLEGVVGVSGLDEACEVIEHRVIDANGQETILKIPGRFSVENITLSFAMHKVNPNPIHEWFEQTHIQDELERKNGSIVLTNDAGEEIMRYEFFNAWPCKWRGPSASQSAGGIAIETIEIAHEGLQRIPGAAEGGR